MRVLSSSLWHVFKRGLSSQCARDGLVLGMYQNEGGFELTPAAKRFDASLDGSLQKVMERHAPNMKVGDSRIFHTFTKYDTVAVVGLGPQRIDTKSQENLNQQAENIRKAIAVGVKALQQVKINSIEIDTASDSEAAAEGACLATFAFKKLKTDKDSAAPPPALQPYDSQQEGSEMLSGWHVGSIKAAAQNLAREWMEMPANVMTPTQFVSTVTQCLQDATSNEVALDIAVRDETWIRDQKMGAFLSVAKGSVEEPRLLDISYTGTKGNDAPLLALVGKGVTFDSGGISIKPSAGMHLMRGDMGGAAVVCATIEALLRLRVQANIRAVVPLCENMVSGCATKPGDVVTAMNGKSIQVDNTDAEGRLLLADALCYAQTFDPRAVVAVSTLTGAIDVALGTGATGAFVNDDDMWHLLHQASHKTGDRVWRMPLFSQYRKQIESHLADINNVGQRGRSAGACTAAAFLNEFVEVEKWASLDAAGVMESHGEVPYLSKGLSGRPTRTLIEFVRLMYGVE
ncbi:cytosol aminopeptidase-like isoform X2 [Corticium candelabrum]|uniref:cytosol aminopeptidase-like isoform X2 n=1 Tax=Corticium candelabrum TaxID=121492 RepID=UPI002E25400D|nr:cytosol aminopeptidase-like isoform X2 [Corticium candelabrum]